MTSANVSKMTANMLFQTNASAKTGKEEHESSDFMGMLGNLTAGYQKNLSANDTKISVADHIGDSKTEYSKYSVKEDRIPEVSDKVDQAQMEEAQKAVEEFADEVQKAVEETFGVSKEQLEEAMSELGLSFADLMNPANLAELVTKLTGQTDSLGLLMNSDFQELMKEVEVLTEDLLQSLGIPAEKAEEFLNGFWQENTFDMQTTEQIQPAEQITDEPQQEIIVTQTDAEEPVDTQKIEVVHKDVESVDAVQEEISVTQEEMSEDTDGGQEENSEDLSQETKTQTVDEQDSVLHRGSGVQEHSKSFEAGMVQTVPTAGNAETAAVNTAGAVPNTAVNVADIIQQVSEFTRIMYRGEVTSMEMQLNPENLGKVYVQVSSKEGVITANIAAQNETVKEALESQVAVLKENMNQQGLKVEAVEVTIASHEFERNLEENQQNQDQEEQREQSSPNGRSDSIRQSDEISGLMSEEEVLAAKIMRDNGNSVDFTA